MFRASPKTITTLFMTLSLATLSCPAFAADGKDEGKETEVTALVATEMIPHETPELHYGAEAEHEFRNGSSLSGKLLLSRHGKENGLYKAELALQSAPQNLGRQSFAGAVRAERHEMMGHALDLAGAQAIRLGELELGVTAYQGRLATDLGHAPVSALGITGTGSIGRLKLELANILGRVASPTGNPGNGRFRKSEVEAVVDLSQFARTRAWPIAVSLEVENKTLDLRSAGRDHELAYVAGIELNLKAAREGLGRVFGRRAE